MGVVVAPPVTVVTTESLITDQDERGGNIARATRRRPETLSEQMLLENGAGRLA